MQHLRRQIDLGSLDTACLELLPLASGIWIALPMAHPLPLVCIALDSFLEPQNMTGAPVTAPHVIAQFICAYGSNSSELTLS
jgi:hypothetical protein